VAAAAIGAAALITWSVLFSAAGSAVRPNSTGTPDQATQVTPVTTLDGRPIVDGDGAAENVALQDQIEMDLLAAR
jgi:hypothetical protein